MSVLADVRVGVRSLAKAPGWTCVALATLSLAIGINATVFTIVNAILFQGLPFADADRIVYLSMRNAQRGDATLRMSFADFHDLRDTARSFDGLAAYAGAQLNVAGDDNVPEVYQAAQLSENSFRLIGQRPIAGRDFAPEDEAPGAPPVAILTYGLWERRYGGDPAAIGRIVRVNGEPTTIVGVMPPEVVFPFNVELWTPLPATPGRERRDALILSVFGVLREGVPLATARAEMAARSADLQRTRPATNAAMSIVVETYREHIVGGDMTTIFSAMLAAVAFVLLIACANVANLQLARALGRVREVSVRVALGATHLQIVRQLLVESVLLSAAAGLIGWIIAYWGARAFDVVVTPMGKPRWIAFTLDFRVLAYLGLMSLAAGVIAGLAPALRLARVDVHSTLKEGGRGTGWSVRHRRLAAALVVSELALAVVLLAGASLMIRSFLNLYGAPLGIDRASVLTMRIVLPAARYPGGERRTAFFDQLQARIEALPGVSVAAIGSAVPAGGSMSLPCEPERSAAFDSSHRPMVSVLAIGRDYFRVWRVGPLRGRAFTDDDAGPPVAIVNEALAARFWPGEDPLTKRVRLFDGPTPEPWLRIAGVVPNIVHNDVGGRRVEPVIYVPFRQRPVSTASLMARTTVPPGTLATAFRREVRMLDADLPVFNLLTMEERLRRNFSSTLVVGSLFTIFAAVALLLASVGLYAVVAHAVSRRTQEIGVRIAMGATGHAVLRLVLADGLWQVALGLTIGLAAAAGVTRVLGSALVGVSPADPIAFALAVGVLAAAAVLGIYVPARRAMRVDPVIALRAE